MSDQQPVLSWRAGGVIRRPAAIVLAKNVTGLATLRALACLSIDLHAVIFQSDEPIAYSRYGKKVYFTGNEHDEPALLAFLIQYSQQLGGRPVVLPTSDFLALFLARNYEALKSCCTTWTNTYTNLAEIICKNMLYVNASVAQVETVPWIQSSDLGAIAEWCKRNSAPYLLKPFYEGSETRRPFGKNKLLHSCEALMAYAAANDMESIIIQRMIQGGDGFIFDTYGYCDRDGRILKMASHRRLRQQPANFGCTSFGEIPANVGAEAEGTIFSATERLLGHVKYHGIFGIEWLLEQSTGKFFLIDFNARPFTTIGHLADCGMNLPALAYAELINETPDKLMKTPALRRILWMDLQNDLDSLRSSERRLLVIAKTWFLTMLRCRSFAYQSWRDPGPGVHKLATIIRLSVQYAFKRSGFRKNNSNG